MSSSGRAGCVTGPSPVRAVRPARERADYVSFRPREQSADRGAQQLELEQQDHRRNSGEQQRRSIMVRTDCRHVTAHEEEGCGPHELKAMRRRLELMRRHRGAISPQYFRNEFSGALEPGAAVATRNENAV